MRVGTMTRACLAWAALVLGLLLAGRPSHGQEQLPAPRPVEKQPAPVVYADKPSDAAVLLDFGRGLCSGTIIACEGGRSLMVSCNHCVEAGGGASVEDLDGGRRGEWTVSTLDGKTTYKATPVAASRGCDLGFYVVDGVLPVARISTTPPAVGAKVEHWGRTSGYTSGRVLRARVRPGDSPQFSFGSTCSSIPGDSGAGVFADGALVAVNWGYMTGTPECGTLAYYIADRAKRSKTIAVQFPRFVAGLDVPAPPAPPASPPPGLMQPVPPVCPPGGCPPPPAPAPLFPRLRWLIGG